MNSLRLLITLSLATLHVLVSSALPAPQQAPITDTTPFTFRNATIEDIDDITTVYIDAFKNGPTWKYIRQFADLYPDYTWACSREFFKRIHLNKTATGSVASKVISVPDRSSYRGERVVSISYWQLDQLQLGNRTIDESLSSTSVASQLKTASRWFTSTPSLEFYSKIQPTQGFDCSAHLDLNITRALHFEKVMLEAADRYLRKPYSRQLYLDLLATHPDWDGHGFAARHLRWGKERLAELNHASGTLEHQIPLTLIGTPAGYPLYISEGFEGLQNITVERLDDGGTLWYEAMKYEDKES